MRGKISLSVVAVILLLSFTVLSGCQTTKSMADDFGDTGKAIAEDTKNLWQGIAKLDDWIKENIW